MRQFLSCLLKLWQILSELVLLFTQFFTIPDFTSLGFSLPLLLFLLIFFNLLLNFLLFFLKFLGYLFVAVQFVQSLPGNPLFPQSQLLRPYILVSMPDFLLLENWLLYLFSFLLPLSFVVDYIFDDLFNCLLSGIVGMACWWLDDGWNLWCFVFAAHLFLLAPHVLHGIVE